MKKLLITLLLFVPLLGISQVNVNANLHEEDMEIGHIKEVGPQPLEFKKDEFDYAKTAPPICAFLIQKVVNKLKIKNVMYE